METLQRNMDASRRVERYVKSTILSSLCVHEQIMNVSLVVPKR